MNKDSNSKRENSKLSDVNNNSISEKETGENYIYLSEIKILLILVIINNIPYELVLDNISKTLNFNSTQTGYAIDEMIRLGFVKIEESQYKITADGINILKKNGIETDNLFNQFKEYKVKKLKFDESYLSNPNFESENELPTWENTDKLKNFFNIPSDKKIDSFVHDSYTTYDYKKRNKTRIISIPNPQLKKIQRFILNNILDQFEASKACHSYTKDKSIVTNAKQHLENVDNGMLKLDITNFFGSIRSNEILDLFHKIGYPKNIAFALANLVVDSNKSLAQGFPTSPKISNLVLKNTDEKLTNFSNDKNLIYTRYSDDMTFSGKTITASSKQLIIEEVASILSSKGLVLNTNKTRFYDKFSQKRVTGLTLNKNGIAIPQKLRKYLDNEIYHIKKHGLLDHLIHTKKINCSNYKGHLYGICSFIKQIDEEKAIKYYNELNKIFDLF